MDGFASDDSDPQEGYELQDFRYETTDSEGVELEEVKSRIYKDTTVDVSSDDSTESNRGFPTDDQALDARLGDIEARIQEIRAQKGDDDGGDSDYESVDDERDPLTGVKNLGLIV